MTYKTTESEGLSFIRYGLGDYMHAIEDAISGELPQAGACASTPPP